MPCDTINEVSVNLGKIDWKIMADGLKAVGYAVQESNGILTFSKGLLSGRINRQGVVTFSSVRRIDEQEETKALKRAYAAQVVTSQATRFGWKVTRDSQNQNRLTMKGGR